MLRSPGYTLQRDLADRRILRVRRSLPGSSLRKKEGLFPSPSFRLSRLVYSMSAVAAEQREAVTTGSLLVYWQPFWRKANLPRGGDAKPRASPRRR